MTDPARGPTTEELRARVLAQPQPARKAQAKGEAALARRAVDQIRDSLATLSYAAGGMYEDEAQVALDALDWLEAYVLARDSEGAERRDATT